jgi:gliding motility-associated-like protein
LFNAELPIGIYEITVRDTNGCIFTVDSIRIAQPANIIVYAFQDQTINLGDLASVYANTNVLQIDSSLVSWYYYRNDSIVNVCTGANCFNIDVANLFENTELIFNLNNGCGDSASVNITVNQRESIFVPNAFTPNGDGQNDVITVFGSTDVQIVNKFMVFDRWGELLFESSDFTPNDLSNGWDGKFKGEFLNPGVFVYYAEFTLVNGRKSTRKGDITIIR